MSILTSYKTAKKEGFGDVFIRYRPLDSHDRGEIERTLRDEFGLLYFTVDILDDL